MGITSSIEQKASNVQAQIKDQVQTQMCLQREIQLSVSMAQARDFLMWYGGLYTVVVSGITVAVLAKKPVPKLAAIPVVMGGFALTNVADMAYGSKLQRVVKEAEHIMQHERAILVPPKQAPFHGKYTEAERAAYRGTGAVSSYWPTFHPWHIEPPKPK
eukprot:TRINITY_DN14050_c0_g1_i2.p2 TRINITY_DN14050_c0_g1~~TRINITY_DN14050_c0_g1_i2.p2  ORF type:complete len:159 (-),score=30.50 TRINITY_DN14050_c0_g1_i2:177-653(-)